MRYALLSAGLFSFASLTSAADWLTLPSTYSHDASGARVTQYAPIEGPMAPSVSNFRSSGYTHTRSSLNYGESADNYHRVEEWGDPVRPYGEWRFPYRPFSTPYSNWGPPLAGFNLGFGFPPFGGGYYPPGHGPGGGKPSHGGGGMGGSGPGMGGSGPGHYPYRGDFERGFLGDGRWPSDREQGRFPLPQASPFNPYPAGPGSPYPVAPYYDGYYPNYQD